MEVYTELQLDLAQPPVLCSSLFLNYFSEETHFLNIFFILTKIVFFGLFNKPKTDKPL